MKTKQVKNRVAFLSLMISLTAATWCGTLSAANYNWDAGTATGYQSTNGTWETSAFWTLNGTTLTAWPGDTTNNAYFAGSSTTVTNFVTVGGSVAVNQLGLGWSGSAKEDNCFVILTNGTITVGSGGIIVNSAKTVLLYSDVVLASNQTWDVRTIALPVYGSIKDGGNGYGITKIGANALSLYSTNNTFSGGITLSGGSLNINSASAIGTGPLTINSGSTLNNTTAVLITNTQNNAMSWNGNFSFGGTMDLNMGTGAVTLGTNVVFTEAGTRTLTVSGVSGAYGLTRTGPGILSFSVNSPFSGGLTINSGAIQSTLSGSGTPFGSNSIVLNGNGNPVAPGNGSTQLKLVPEATGATALTGGTDSGSLFSFANTAYFYLARKDPSSPLTYTFGPGSGTVLNRVDKGVLVIQDNGNTVPAYLGISGGNNFIINGTAPAINNGMVDAYYIGGRSGGQGDATFLTYDNTYGFKPVTYDYSPAAGTLTPTGWNNTKKVKLGGISTLNTDAAVYALSVENGSAASFTNNATLTIGDGTHVAGLLVNDAGIYGSGTINFGTSEGLIYAGNSPVIANVVAGSGGLTKAQYDGTNYKLTLTANPTYTGTTTVNNGTLEFTSSAVSLGAVQGLGTLQYSGAGTLNLVQSSSTLSAGTLVNASSGTMNLTLSGGDTMTTVQNTSSGTLNINSVSGTNTIITLTSSGAGGKITFSGAGSVNTVAGSFQGNNAASTNIFTAGNWYFAGPGNSGANRMGTLIVDGAFVSFAGGRYVDSGGGTINVNAGQLQFMGDRFNPGGDYPNSVLINVSGGLLDVAQTQYGFSLGANGGIHALTVTGGMLQYGFSIGTGANAINFIIGAGASKVGTNTVSLAGGTLRSLFPLSGSSVQSASVQQRFNWTGGTLAALGMNMANLGSSDGITTYASGVLLNGGGTLAPGDIGTAGKTTITGSYSNTPSAVLAIDIGGTSQGSAFTNASGYYDYLLVNNGSTYLAGKLMVSLINGYVPASPATAFTVINNTGTVFGVTGTFANLSGKILPLTDGYSLFTNVTQSATNVVLSGYAVNEYLGGSWDSASSWSQGVIPANQDYAAYFGTLASSFTPNAGTRTLKGLVFANTSSFTLSGSALTLQGDASIKVTAGSHTISVPIALSNATAIAVESTSVLTLSGNVTGAQNVTKTGTGTLALGGANTLGALTVSAGTVKQSAGTTTLASLSLTAGVYDLWAGTLRIAVGTAGGAIDTVAEVEAAITAGTIQGRGKTLPVSEFKISVADGYVRVELKAHGTVISFL